uniref:Uncharacterized protein n=1 Tax=Cyprinus carpio TaxID=7962 RepID=A0A8C1VDM8_CYPCA
MAASGSTVSVLTPNGRRQTVKVSANTPLLQVGARSHTRVYTLICSRSL